MKIYAAYGSNMNLRQMAKRCPEAKVMGVGILNNYRLVFRGSGHANIEVRKGHKVPIVLWEITQKCERVLDRYEGYPSYYIKKEVLVETESGDKKSMVYVMASDYESIITEPTDSYYNIIYKGYLDNNISVEALEEALIGVDLHISKE